MYGAGAAWSRLFLPGAGAGADPSRSEPESAPGPWSSGAGAAQKSGGSATLLKSTVVHLIGHPLCRGQKGVRLRAQVNQVADTY